MAKTSQLFSVVGITIHNGNAKVRFGVDYVRRIKQFTKGGATRIDLIELPNEMSRLDALEALKAHPDFQSPEDQATITEAIYNRTPKTPKAKKAKEVKVKATKPSLDAIKARGKKKDVTAEEVLAATQSVE